MNTVPGFVPQGSGMVQSTEPRDIFEQKFLFLNKKGQSYSFPVIIENLRCHEICVESTTIFRCCKNAKSAVIFLFCGAI